MAKKQVTLQKLKNLVENEDKRIHGASYNNVFFDNQFLAWSEPDVSVVDPKEKRLRARLTTRIPYTQRGLQQVENTKEALHMYEIGTVPGFSIEEYLEVDRDIDDIIDEPITATDSLVSVSILIDIQEPVIQHETIIIAGEVLEKITIHSAYESFTQFIEFVFGKAEKLTLLSHFYGRNIGTSQSKRILDLMFPSNVTGQVIVGARMETPQSVSTIFPNREMLDGYLNTEKQYVVMSGDAFIKFRDEMFRGGSFEIEFHGMSGRVTLRWTHTKFKWELFLQ